MLRYHYVPKHGKVPRCGDCGLKLNGIPGLRPKESRSVSKGERTINRAYGGSRCAHCVRDRYEAAAARARGVACVRVRFGADRALLVCSIVRAFLIEEQKIVKAVMRQQKPAAAEQPKEKDEKKKKPKPKSDKKEKEAGKGKKAAAGAAGPAKKK